MGGAEGGRGSKLGGGVRDCTHNHCTHFSLSDSSLELSSTFTTFFRFPAPPFFNVVLALVAGGGGLFLTVVLAAGTSVIVELRQWSHTSRLWDTSGTLERKGCGQHVPRSLINHSGIYRRGNGYTTVDIPSHTHTFLRLLDWT